MSTENTTEQSTPANVPPASDLAERIAAGVIETAAEAEATGEPAPAVKPDVSGRFADLGLDLDDSGTAPASTVETDPPLPLEIDGVTVPSNVEPPVSQTPALDALRAAGLDFPVELVQPEVPVGSLPVNSSWVSPPNVKDFQLCMRMDTGRIFGIVSPDYGYVQPSELARTVDAALPEGAGNVNVRGSAFGDFMWFDCDLPLGTFDISPEMQAEANGHKWVHTDPRDSQGNIPIKARLLFKHAYGGKGAYDLSLLIEALVCANGMCIPLMDGTRRVSIRHTRNFAERVAMLQHAFHVAGGAVNATAGMLAEMTGTKITAAQFDQYAKALFKGESTQAKNKRKRFEEIYQTAVGAAPGTAWGALQAGTYHATHETPVRVGGRSLRNYTLDDPANVSPAQLEGYQGQARLELLVNGAAGQFTERAFQYVTNNMLGAA